MSIRLFPFWFLWLLTALGGSTPVSGKEKDSSAMHHTIDQDKAFGMILYGIKGRLMEQSGNVSGAIALFREGLTAAEGIDNPVMKRFLYGELARLYGQLPLPDSVRYYRTMERTVATQVPGSALPVETLREVCTDLFATYNKELTFRLSRERDQFLSILGVLLVFLLLLGSGMLYYKRLHWQLAITQKKRQLEAEKMEASHQELLLKVALQEKQLEEYGYRLSKNALLQSLVGELQALVSDQKQEGTSKRSENSGKIWDEFDLRFLQTHAGFYDRLLKACPGLTMNERRLCAFLLLDMSTKEISVITGQSTRAVEIARTRLRKKLNLTQSDTSLFTFLSYI